MKQNNCPQIPRKTQSIYQNKNPALFYKICSYSRVRQQNAAQIQKYQKQIRQQFADIQAKVQPSSYKFPRKRGSYFDQKKQEVFLAKQLQSSTYNLHNQNQHKQSKRIVQKQTISNRKSSINSFIGKSSFRKTSSIIKHQIHQTTNISSKKIQFGYSRYSTLPSGQQSNKKRLNSYCQQKIVQNAFAHKIKYRQKQNTKKNFNFYCPKISEPLSSRKVVHRILKNETGRSGKSVSSKKSEKIENHNFFDKNKNKVETQYKNVLLSNLKQRQAHERQAEQYTV